MHVDAIVNTTNEKLIGYSGVDLAIHTIAGAELDAECAKLAPLGLGQANMAGSLSFLPLISMQRKRQRTSVSDVREPSTIRRIRRG